MKYNKKILIKKRALFAWAVVLAGAALSSAAAAERQALSSESLLHEIAMAPSAENLETDIRKLVASAPVTLSRRRVSDVRGIGAARRWIKSEFEAISAACGGCLEVDRQSDVVEGRRIPSPPRWSTSWRFSGVIVSRTATWS